MKQFSLEEAVRAGLVDQHTMTNNKETIPTEFLEESEESGKTQIRKKMPKPKQSEYSVVRFVFYTVQTVRT